MAAAVSRFRHSSMNSCNRNVNSRLFFVFLSVPRFSPHQASASVHECLSIRAFSILISSAKSLISTRCYGSASLLSGYTYLDAFLLSQGFRSLDPACSKQMIDDEAVERPIGLSALFSALSAGRLSVHPRLTESEVSCFLPLPLAPPAQGGPDHPSPS